MNDDLRLALNAALLAAIQAGLSTMYEGVRQLFFLGAAGVLFLLAALIFLSAF